MSLAGYLLATAGILLAAACTSASIVVGEAVVTHIYFYTGIYV
jgi:hypothetical protein